MNIVLQPEGAHTCGQCCVAMVVGAMRAEIIARLKKRGGTNARDLRRALSVYGFDLGAVMLIPTRWDLSLFHLDGMCLVRARYVPKGRKRWTHWMLWDGARMICPDRGVLPDRMWYQWTARDAEERLTSFYRIEDRRG